ncbi:MAG: polysaccharide biosynthesis C-terminal domain-containing protein, partial [Actinomycetota bacterium]
RAQDRRFFRQGAVGSAASHEAGLVMSKHALAATLPVSIALWILAPYVDLLLSDQWAEVEDVIRLLALLPVIKGFQFSFGNALTAAGNQSARMWMTGVAAVANVGGNLILIPRGSWQAAAWTTLIAELALTVGFLAASMFYAQTRADQSR